eukprot:13619016-Ditylum_brightwellii.AAC.1
MRKGCDSQPLVIHTNGSRAHCCNIAVLLCASCQYGKGLQTGSGDKHFKERDMGTLKVEDLIPGQKVSVDQYVSKTKGCLPNTKGKESSASECSGGTIYVDYASK